MIRPVTMLAAALATPALAQIEATVSLTHDDADGIINVGESATWTLAISHTGGTGNESISSINAAILGDNTLGTSANFAYNQFGDGLGFDGGTNGGTSNGAGINFVNFTNHVFLDVGPAPIRTDNPLTVGTFDFTASQTGVLEYDIALGLASSFFLTIDISAFDSEAFANPEDVALVIDTLTIVPAPASALLLAPAGMLAVRRRR